MRWTIVRQWAAAFAMVAVLAGVASFTLARPAAADNTAAPAPQGMQGLAPAPDGLQQGNQPTLAERYPETAYDIPVDPGSIAVNAIEPWKSDPLSQAANVAQSTLWATTELSWLESVVTLTTSLVEWSFSLDVVGAAAGPVGQSTQALAEQVYYPLLIVVIGLTGGWLAWHVLVRRRTIRGLEGASWSIGVAVAAGIYFASPATIMTAVNGLDGALGQGVLAAMTSADPAIVARAGDPTYAKGDASSAELRAFADRLWRADVFVPWSVAVFGDTKSATQYGEAFLQAHSSGQSYNLPDGTPSDVVDWYHGGNGQRRAAILGVALGVALLMCGLYLAIAGMLIATQFGLLVLFMVLPLFLLAGAHPGWGRARLMRWLDLVFLVLALRILTTAVMGIVLILSGIIASIPSWAVSEALQIVLVLTVWKGRKVVFSSFGRLVGSTSAPAGQSRVAQVAQAGWKRVAVKVRPRVVPPVPVPVPAVKP